MFPAVTLSVTLSISVKRELKSLQEETSKVIFRYKNLLTSEHYWAHVSMSRSQKTSNEIKIIYQFKCTLVDYYDGMSSGKKIFKCFSGKM